MAGVDPRDAARVSRHLGALQREFSPAGMKPDLTKLGMLAKAEVGRATTGTLGDLSMSNWRRGKPIPITGRFDQVDASTVEVSPMPRARGPMRVLESGRQARGQSSKVSFRTLKSGAVRVRHGKTSRAVGATAGKGTWTHAVAAMERTVVKGMKVQTAAKWRKALGG